MYNYLIPRGTPVILSKNSQWHRINPGPHNPSDEVGFMDFDSDDSIEVTWPSQQYGVFYESDETDLIPLFGKFSRQQMRELAQIHSLVVADCGLDEQYRWQLATREI